MIIGNENDQKRQQHQTETKRPNWGQIAEKAEHGKNLRKIRPGEYKEWLSAVKKMRDGGDCGQIEPWSPYTLRDVYYNGWADGDFGTLLSQLGESDLLWGKNAPESKD